MGPLPDIYPLTSLQIGDIQSYHSQAFVYFSSSTKSLLIFVDNRPWSSDALPRSKLTRLWQSIVTKCRDSPFINSRTLAKGLDHETNCSERSCIRKLLLSGVNLRLGLQGFIVFDVALKDVCGINYSNELQTDTSLALEVKSMRKWEFKSLEEAISHVSSWFFGTPLERDSITKNLRKISALKVSDLISLTSSSVTSFRSASLLEVLPGDIFYDAETSLHDKEENELNDWTNESVSSQLHSVEEESKVVPIQYTDNLLLLKSSDCILPFKLKQVLTSNLRLLRKLESGLPSWVVFFESYPLFCHIYRPWMRHFATALYILISLCTFVIAFYDLYKNVPLLKATVSGLCCPFFEWIESRDMLSRIQYLSTMLFLQNFEKAAEWLLTISRSTRPMFVVMTRPITGTLIALAEILYPVWNVCVKTGELLMLEVLFVVEFFYTAYLGLIGALFSPFEFLYSSFWNLAILVYPVFCSVMELLRAPIQYLFTSVSYAALASSDAYILMKSVWKSTNMIMPVMYLSKAKQGAKGISIWQGLWNDLFKQVFRAIACILKSLLALFSACNRHRLSNYRHAWVLFLRLAHTFRLAPHKCWHHQAFQDQFQKGNYRECDFCK